MTGFFSGLYVLVFYTSVGLGFWYGTRLALTGSIQPGVVLAVFWAVIFGALQIGQALPSLGAVFNAKIAAKQIFDVIDKVLQQPQKLNSNQFSETKDVVCKNEETPIIYNWPTSV